LASIGGGGGGIGGSIADNQIAVGSGADTVEGTSGLTYDANGIGFSGDAGVERISAGVIGVNTGTAGVLGTLKADVVQGMSQTTYQLQMVNEAAGGASMRFGATANSWGVGGNKFSIYDSNAASHRLTIANAIGGLVGINKTTPGAQLHVTASSASTVGQIIELAVTPTANAFEINSNGGNGGDMFRISNTGVQTNKGRSGANRIELTTSTGETIWFGREANQAYISVLQSKPIQFRTSNTTRMTVGSSGDILLGTATAPSANGGKVLAFGDNTADPTMATDTAGIYAKDVAGTVEMFAVDEAANATQISPHDAEGDWIFYSENTRTGKKIRIDVERFFRERYPQYYHDLAS
jgi:hypothetical protein